MTALLLSISTLFIVEGYVPGKKPILHLRHIDFPSLPIQHQLIHRPDSTLYYRIHDTRLWLDSIKQKKIKSIPADSILFYRPGLYDSLVLAEKIIQ